LQGSLFQVDIAQIIVDEADEPNSLVDFFNAEPLSGQDGGDVDFLSVDADTAAGDNEDVAVVEGIIEVRQAAVGAPLGEIDLGGHSGPRTWKGQQRYLYDAWLQGFLFGSGPRPSAMVWRTKAKKKAPRFAS